MVAIDTVELIRLTMRSIHDECAKPATDKKKIQDQCKMILRHLSHESPANILRELYDNSLKVN